MSAESATTFPSRSGTVVEMHRFRPTTELQAREARRSCCAAEQAYRQTCFAFLRLCFRSASADQIRKAADLMRVAREEMERRQ